MEEIVVVGWYVVWSWGLGRSDMGGSRTVLALSFLV